MIEVANDITKDSANGCYQIILDGAFFDLESVRKTVYEYSGSYFTDINLIDNNQIKVSLTPKNETADNDFFIKNFSNHVVDYQIREKIDKETSKIKEIIVDYAYSSVKKN